MCLINKGKKLKRLSRARILIALSDEYPVYAGKAIIKELPVIKLASLEILSSTSTTFPNLHPSSLTNTICSSFRR